MSGPVVAALYGWLEGCESQALRDLSPHLRAAVSAGGFTQFHATSGPGWALAVVGESHVLLRADGVTLLTEVVSCSTVDAARRAVAAVRAAVPHARASEELRVYRDGAFSRAG